MRILIPNGHIECNRLQGSCERILTAIQTKSIIKFMSLSLSLIRFKTERMSNQI